MLARYYASINRKDACVATKKKKAAKTSPQSAGGIARAEVLTPTRRRRIAKAAAEARWGAEKALPVAKWGASNKPLRIGAVEIPCYVLEDGRRMLAQRGLHAGIGLSQGGGKGGARKLASFMVSLEKKGVDVRNLPARANSPIRFVPPHGGNPADGYEAAILPDLCAVILEADRFGALDKRLTHVVERCAILQNAFATVGIIALVDEATGYQGIRPQDALEKYLAMILRKELAAWSKRFPDEFYENIYKLRGWIWPGMSVNRYSAVAGYTRNLVYERIAPSLLQELELRNPSRPKVGRASKHHQWLTDDVGHPMLAQHLHSLVMLQRLAMANGHGWVRFMRMVDQVMPRKGRNLELPFTGLDPIPTAP